MHCFEINVLSIVIIITVAIVSMNFVARQFISSEEFDAPPVATTKFNNDAVGGAAKDPLAVATMLDRKHGIRLPRMFVSEQENKSVQTAANVLASISKSSRPVIAFSKRKCAYESLGRSDLEPLGLDFAKWSPDAIDPFVVKTIGRFDSVYHYVAFERFLKLDSKFAYRFVATNAKYIGRKTRAAALCASLSLSRLKEHKLFDDKHKKIRVPDLEDCGDTDESKMLAVWSTDCKIRFIHKAIRAKFALASRQELLIKTTPSTLVYCHDSSFAKDAIETESRSSSAQMYKLCGMGADLGYSLNTTIDNDQTNLYGQILQVFRDKLFQKRVDAAGR